LEAPVARAVETLRGALGVARAFDPRATEDVFRVAAVDAEQAVVIPALAARLRGEAPGLRLSVLPLGRRAAIDALVDGRAELAIGFLWDLPETVSGERLYEEGFLVAGRADVLSDAPHVSLDAYCAADHILISPKGDLRGIVDEALATFGRSRRVILGLSAFLPSLAAAAAMPALVTLPARVANAFAPGFGLVLAEPPLDIRQFPVSVFWHRRNDRDPKTEWIRQQLRLVCCD
jgi:DNA-binding transcriptional LysR family regulator